MRASTSRNSTSSSLLGGPAQPFAQNAEQLARYDRPFEQQQKRTARDDQQFAIGHRRASAVRSSDAPTLPVT